MNNKKVTVAKAEEIKAGFEFDAFIRSYGLICKRHSGEYKPYLKLDKTKMVATAYYEYEGNADNRAEFVEEVKKLQDERKMRFIAFCKQLLFTCEATLVPMKDEDYDKLKLRSVFVGTDKKKIFKD